MCGCHEPVHVHVPHHHHVHVPHHHYGHWCCCPPCYGPRWPTKEEELEELRGYKEQLERELERINKRLEELGK